RRDLALDRGHVDVERAQVDVDEDGRRTAIHYGVGRRDVGQRGDDDLVTGPDTEGEERQVEGGRARRRRARKARSREGGEPLFELADLRPLHDPASEKTLRYGADLLFTEAGLRYGDVHGPFRLSSAARHSISRSSPSRRGTFASNPRSSLLLRASPRRSV